MSAAGVQGIAYARSGLRIWIVPKPFCSICLQVAERGGTSSSLKEGSIS